LLVAALVTLVVTALGYFVPESLSGSLIGLCFLAATYWLVLRSRSRGVEREYGVGLGGLLEPEPIVWRKVLAAALRAGAMAFALSLLVLPPFWFGYVYWYGAHGEFVHTVGAWEGLDQLLAQLTVVALPEEAFYRGYLQTSLDRIWRPRLKLLGATVGPGLLIASLIFAVGHVLTEPFLGRLAVFFPSLLFGWLRAKTGGIGAAVAFHAACNSFAWYLGRGYGFISDS
jgi:hypothetical protein